MINGKIKLLSNSREDAEQFNGREGKTATLYERCLLNSGCVLPVSPHVISAVSCLPTQNRLAMRSL